MFIGPPIKEKRLLKKLKILLFWGSFIFKTEIVDIFNFPWLNCFSYFLSFSNIWHISVNYCWNYGPSNLLFRFTWYSWQQLNNRQRKTAVNLLLHFFWKVLSIAVSGESFKFFDKRTLKLRSFAIFVKLNRNDISLAVSAKFAEYQSNVLTEMHNFG